MARNDTALGGRYYVSPRYQYDRDEVLGEYTTPDEAVHQAGHLAKGALILFAWTRSSKGEVIVKAVGENSRSWWAKPCPQADKKGGCSYYCVCKGLGLVPQ